MALNPEAIFHVIVMTPQILYESLEFGFFNLNLGDLLLFFTGAIMHREDIHM
jgi:hypothetical protein